MGTKFPRAIVIGMLQVVNYTMRRSDRNPSDVEALNQNYENISFAARFYIN